MSEQIPVGELARKLAVAKMAADPTVGGTTQTLIQLQKLADEDWAKFKDSARRNNVYVPCKQGCDYCCHEPVRISGLEAVVLAGYVSTHFRSEERAALSQRAESYHRLSRAGARANPCPFLVAGSCSIYEMRPMACRGTHSVDLNVCKMRLEIDPKPDRPGAYPYTDVCRWISQGFNLATPGKFFPDALELGLLAERIAKGADLGEHVLEALQYKDRPAPNPNEPPGISLYTPRDISPYLQMRDDQDMEGALTQTHGMHDTAQRLLSFVVPLAYKSAEESEDWWLEAQAAMFLLEQKETDPSVAFDTLPYHSTYPLGYTDKPLLDLYSRFGRWVLDKVMTPLFPDLVAPMDTPRKPGKIRVGYASTELGFRNGSQWSIGWLESHGADVETYAINLGYLEDCVTERFMRSADHYLSLPANVPAAARAIRALDLDLLIYPGVGESGRAAQFASFRLARNQATGWGYPATSGLPNMDYYLCGEDFLLPEGDAEFTEKLVRLPGTGLILDEPYRPPGPDNLPPLPGEYFLMGHNLAKLHPKYDWIWSEISRKAGRGLVMVQHSNPQLTAIVKKRMMAVGANILWLPFMNQNQYERLLGGALASFDPQIWTGGYTGFLSMKLGVPTVTMAGPWMRTRLSVAFMRQAGGADLIASRPEEFIEMACDRERQRATRARIDRRAVFGDNGVSAALNAFVQSCV